MSGRFTHAAVAVFLVASLVASPLYAQDQQAPAPAPAQDAQTPGRVRMPTTPRCTNRPRRRGRRRRLRAR